MKLKEFKSSIEFYIDVVNLIIPKVEESMQAIRLWRYGSDDNEKHCELVFENAKVIIENAEYYIVQAKEVIDQI